MTTNECTGHKGDYFNYDCYNRLSNYFNSIKLVKRDEGYLNDYIESSGNHRSFVNQYNDLFKNLSKHLGGDALFIDLGYHICCPYINYLLNFNIEKKRRGSLENKFENFALFADYYAKRKFSTLFEKNTCKSYLKPILNEKIYIIMKRLYDMYYSFNLVKIYAGMQNNERICHFYSLVNFYYKDLYEISKTNTDLSNTLNHFARVIKSSVHSYDRLCGKNLLSLISPPTVTKQGPEISEISGQPSSTVVAPDSKNHEVLEQQVDGTGRANQQDLLEKSNVEESPREVLPETDLPNVDLEPENLAAVSLPALSEDIYQGNNRLEGLNIRPEVEMNALVYGVINREGDFTPIQGHLPQNESEAKGILTNVQDTFFSIVKDVEPGPVLGVSGGMGALFLLFKYTPVGSFFGGRRRRIHQIPSSFRGFPPGDFANFQEYGGGYVGYSPMDMPFQGE